MIQKARSSEFSPYQGWRAFELKAVADPTVRNFLAGPDVPLRVMMTFLLWCVLLFFCWPLALLALVLYPLVWLILLPFRIVGIAVDGVLELLKAMIFLPSRILGGRRVRT